VTEFMIVTWTMIQGHLEQHEEKRTETIEVTSIILQVIA
jgi:hypothetical protein